VGLSKITYPKNAYNIFIILQKLPTSSLIPILKNTIAAADSLVRPRSVTGEEMYEEDVVRTRRAPEVSEN
jgi:hypothetical protein